MGAPGSAADGAELIQVGFSVAQRGGTAYGITAAALECGEESPLSFLCFIPQPRTKKKRKKAAIPRRTPKPPRVESKRPPTSVGGLLLLRIACGIIHHRATTVNCEGRLPSTSMRLWKTCLPSEPFT